MLLRDEESPALLGDVDANGRRCSRATRWRGDKGPGGTVGLLPARPLGMRCGGLCTPGYVQWVVELPVHAVGLRTLVLHTLCTHTRGHGKPREAKMPREVAVPGLAMAGHAVAAVPPRWQRVPKGARSCPKGPCRAARQGHRPLGCQGPRTPQPTSTMGCWGPLWELGRKKPPPPHR